MLYLRSVWQRIQIFTIGIILGGIVIGGSLVRYNRQKEVKIETVKQTVIQKLEAVGNLETATMTLQTSVKGKEQLTDYLPSKQRDNSIQDFLFKDELTLNLEAKVVAGYNLKALSKDSLIVHDDASVSLQLPEPQILHSYLTDTSTSIERQTGIFTKGKITLESEVRNSALKNLEKQALEKGVLQEAKKNATSLIQQLFGTLGIQVRDVKTQSRFD